MSPSIARLGRADRVERVLRRHRVRARRRPPLPPGGGRGRPARRPAPRCAAPASCRCCSPGPSWASPCAPWAWARSPNRPSHDAAAAACCQTGDCPPPAADVAGVRAGADRGHVPAPRGRRDGAEVLGDRPPGTLGDAAGPADARVHVRSPGRVLLALNAVANRCLRAVGVRTRRRGRRRPQPRRPARAGRPLRHRPARWTSERRDQLITALELDTATLRHGRATPPTSAGDRADDRGADPDVPRPADTCA